MNFRFSFLILKLHETYYKNKKYTMIDEHKNVINYKMEHWLRYAVSAIFQPRNGGDYMY